MEAGELQRRAGANIRAIREATGMSQEEYAAEVSKVHRTYQSSVERGLENLSLQTLERLADRIGVDPMDLLKPVDQNSR